MPLGGKRGKGKRGGVGEGRWQGRKDSRIFRGVWRKEKEPEEEGRCVPTVSKKKPKIIEVRPRRPLCRLSREQPLRILRRIPLSVTRCLSTFTGVPVKIKMKGVPEAPGKPRESAATTHRLQVSSASANCIVRACCSLSGGRSIGAAGVAQWKGSRFPLALSVFGPGCGCGLSLASGLGKSFSSPLLFLANPVTIGKASPAGDEGEINRPPPPPPPHGGAQSIRAPPGVLPPSSPKKRRRIAH